MYGVALGGGSTQRSSREAPFGYRVPWVPLFVGGSRRHPGYVEPFSQTSRRIRVKSQWWWWES
jgi:hypothetical protein